MAHRPLQFHFCRLFPANFYAEHVLVDLRHLHLRWGRIFAHFDRNGQFELRGARGVGVQLVGNRPVAARRRKLERSRKRAEVGCLLGRICESCETLQEN